ncbi:AAA family ATPase [Streptomyces sp. NPDC002855]|uniref:AAA family ATPase n=1 Tax=Streptomyces sp. NPDC002855 TaxID=3154437 RepID=UPI0033248D13
MYPTTSYPSCSPTTPRTSRQKRGLIVVAIDPQKTAEWEAKLAPPVRQLKLTHAKTVVPERVRWLWRDRIPMGELTLIAGKGGVGKSTLLATQTAWITTGDMKGEFYGQAKAVLYVANEDSLKYTVVPRLTAAGADLSRVYFVHASIVGQEDRVTLPYDCDALLEIADAVDAAAIMLDPLSSNLKLDNGNDATKVRPIIEQVRRMAEQGRLAVIGLAHTKKALTTNLMDAIIGSSELGNVTRSAMGVMADPDEQGAIVLSQEKNNLGRNDLPGYKYRITTYKYFSNGEEISTGKLEFIGKTDQSVSEMLADQATGAGSTSEVTEWLKDYLTREGTSLRTDILKDARKEDYSVSAVGRAKIKLKVISRRSNSRGGAAVWELPLLPMVAQEPEQPSSNHGQP